MVNSVHIGIDIRPVRVVDYEKIREFLLETKTLYPGIGNWWDKQVCPSIELGKRVVFVVDMGGCIEGLFIGKRGVSAKICTLRLRKSIRYHGVGKDLLKEGLGCLIDQNTNQLHATISGAAEEVCKYFFESIGFEQKAIEANRYNRGVEEFIYSCPVDKVVEIIGDAAKR